MLGGSAVPATGAGKGIGNLPPPPETKAGFKARAEERLAAIDAQITKLKAEARGTKGKKRAGLDKEIRNLENQRSRIRDDLRRVNSTSDWQKIRNDVNRGLDRLDKDIKKVLHELKTG